MNTPTTLADVIAEARDFAARAPDLSDDEIRHAKHMMQRCRDRQCHRIAHLTRANEARRQSGIAEARRLYQDSITKTIKARLTQAQRRH